MSVAAYLMCVDFMCIAMTLESLDTSLLVALILMHLARTPYIFRLNIFVKD